MIDVNDLQEEYRDIENAIKKYGLGVGAKVWIIRNICKTCPKSDDQCFDCLRKTKKYLEKSEILRVNITLRGDEIPAISFVDTELSEFSITDLNKTVFIDKEEAIEKL